MNSRNSFVQGVCAGLQAVLAIFFAATGQWGWFAFALTFGAYSSFMGLYKSGI